MTKFVLSLAAILIGWASGFCFYAIYMTLFTPWRRPTDIEAILAWTAIFVILAWLIVVLPFVFLVSDSSRLLRYPTAMIVGAAGGILSFGLLVGWWTGLWNDGLYLGYALVVGAATGGAYSGLLRIRR